MLKLRMVVNVSISNFIFCVFYCRIWMDCEATCFRENCCVQMVKIVIQSKRRAQLEEQSENRYFYFEKCVYKIMES